MKNLSTYTCENLEIVLEKNIHYLKNKPAMPLSRIKKTLAKKAVQTNAVGFDKEIEYKKELIRVGDLKPSQSQLSISKILTICFNKYFETGVPDKLGLIVSSDGYIIDGHHRWGACVLTDPDKKVEVYRVNLDANHLISVLNILTLGYLGKVGNISRGRIENFNPNYIRRMIMNAQLGKCLTKVGVERINEYIHKLNLNNLSKAKITPKAGAFERVNMPVVDGADIENVLKLLKSGKVDFGIF